jgi:hypothetical protein
MALTGSVLASWSLRIDASGQGSLYVLEIAIAAGAIDHVGYEVVLPDELLMRWTIQSAQSKRMVVSYCSIRAGAIQPAFPPKSIVALS